MTSELALCLNGDCGRAKAEGSWYCCWPCAQASDHGRLPARHGAACGLRHRRARAWALTSIAALLAVAVAGCAHQVAPSRDAAMRHQQDAQVRQVVRGLCLRPGPVPAGITAPQLRRICREWGFPDRRGGIRTAAAVPVPVIPCRPGVSPACAAWRDTTASGPCVQDIEFFDHNWAPEFWVNNCGGTWAGNDMLGVTGKSVFADIAYLAPSWRGQAGPCPRQAGCRGVLVLDGRRLSARDIAGLHQLEALTGPDLRFLLCLESRPVAACRAARRLGRAAGRSAS